MVSLLRYNGLNNKNKIDTGIIPTAESLGLTDNYIHELLKAEMRKQGFKTFIDLDGKERPLNEENA